MNQADLEDQIERWVERQQDRLDKRFLKGDLTQEEYDIQCKLISNEADQRYRQQTSNR